MKKCIVAALVLVASLLGVPTAHSVNTDNYTISSYSVEMKLGRDSENRSMLEAKETITALFPDYDQNHGLERIFVRDYDGHGTAFTLVSVTDAGGAVLPYRWDGNALRIGDSDTYVHGSQTYVITYMQRDVTRYYGDADADEFYWDVIGTEWRVPITEATITLTLDPGVASAVTGDKACYRGGSGSTTTCDVREADGVYSADVTNLQPNEGVTVAVGFKQGTFAAYVPTLWEKVVQIWGVVQLIASPLAIGAAIWFVIRWVGKMGRKKEIGTIVPEYLPPGEASVTTAAKVYGLTVTKVMTAQVLDLAVRHYIKIYETKEKKLFSPAEYEIEITKDISDLRAEEQEVLKDMFDMLPQPGQRLNLKKLKNNTAYYNRTLDNESVLNTLIRGEYGLRERDPAAKTWLRRIALVGLGVGVLLGSPFWLVGVALVAFILSFVSWRLTDKGLALKRYLEGLKLYIGVAEAERLAMLQSPGGAEKVATVVDGMDSAQLIKLYERVLPYAVLFGQEKEWNKQLGQYYETANTSPEWYSGHSAVFNAAVFSSAMNGFSTSSSAASSYSSSSSGSGGGGFSGGGGGGGGGGGW